MANFVVFVGYLCQNFQVIQARRIRVELSIADQKLEGKKSRRGKRIQEMHKILAPYESRVRNFGTLRKLFLIFFALLTSFDFFFLFFQFYPSCIMGIEGIFVFFSYLSTIEAQMKSCRKDLDFCLCWNIEHWAGVFPLFFFYFIFSHFLPFSQLPNTPLRMTTQRMVG